MWMYECFDGDDMDIALAQHDLYFGRDVPPGYGIAGRYYTLGWWWHVLLEQAARQQLWIPWLHRHWQRLQLAGNFSHKLLQHPHEHMAAYYRWSQRGGIAPQGARPTRKRGACDTSPRGGTGSGRNSRT